MRSLLLLSCLTLPSCLAAEPVTGPFPLEQALRLARDRNPEIRAARQEVEMAAARVLPAKTLPPPQVGVEFMGFSGASPGSAAEKWYDFAQDVPFPGKLHLRGQVAAHDARRQSEIARGAELDVLERVKQAYYRFLYVTKAKGILDENAEVMRRLAKTAEARYATGKTPQTDVLRAQVELSKTLAALVTLEDERVEAQAQLNALLDQAPDSPLGAPQEPDLAALALTQDQLQRAALAERPEVRAAAHHIDHMRSSLAASRSEYLPDFMLQYTRRTRDGMPNDSIAMVKMTLPFLYFWRRRAEDRGVAAELGHAEATLRFAEDSARADVKTGWTKVQTVGRLLELYRTSILPQAEQSEKVAEAAYVSERIDFLSLMDSQRALLEFRLDYDQYLSQYGESVARLERALGTDLADVAAAHEEMRHDHE